MEEKEKGNGNGGLFGFVRGAVDTVRNTVQDIKLPDVKLPNVKLPEIKMPAIKMPDIKLQNPFVVSGGKEEEKGIPAEIRNISAKSAIKMVYYMMAADGEIRQEEEATFGDIAKEFDPDYEQKKDLIAEECGKQLSKVIDPDDYTSVLQDGIEEAILAGANVKESSITPKILAWDLLTIAYSDKDYSEKERQILKYIVRKLNIDKTVFLEMESSYRTLIDIENELAWIKSTDRPYLTIEAMVNELSDRKAAILDSVRDLIAL